MPPRLYGVSPAKLDAWRSCPKRYYWQYLDRPPVPQRLFARTMMGNAAHLALRTWWAERPESHEDALASIDSIWDDSLFRDATQAKDAYERVRAWVSSYLHKTHGDRAIEVRGVERTLSTTTEHLSISGRIDRIDQRGEQAVVIDYKTGRTASRDDDARTSMTLAVYADAVRRSLRQPCFQVELHHLPSGSIARHIHTPESLERHLRRADEIGIEIRDAVAARGSGGEVDALFPVSPGSLCGWCSYWSICPSGQAAAAQREPWVGVDEDHADSSGEWEEHV